MFFCRSGTGDLIGWDPTDLQDRRQREYGIYEWGRGDTSRKLADSFPQFIEEVCLSEANLHPPSWDFKELGTRRTFFPAYDVSDSGRA